MKRKYFWALILEAESEILAGEFRLARISLMGARRILAL